MSFVDGEYLTHKLFSLAFNALTWLNEIFGANGFSLAINIIYKHVEFCGLDNSVLNGIFVTKIKRLIAIK